MKLEAHHYPGTTVLHVGEPRIDAAGAVGFKDRVRELTAGGTGRVVLDLADVQFVDSSGLGAIVAAMKHMQPAQQMELCALTPRVDKVFRLTKLDSVFPIHLDAGEAIADAKLAG